ncbi:MAG: gamma-glutamyltransferase [Desulfobacterales bacterium]
MKFRFNQKREWSSAAQRSVSMACGAMVASSQPLASLSGCRVLAAGGNAVDAAVAMAATLCAVEPYSVGIGGDSFALFAFDHGRRVVGMNGSGRAPRKATLEGMRAGGHTRMPQVGMLSVTVPGALKAWSDALERYGRLTLGDVLQDAIRYAEEGVPVSEVIAGEWREATALLAAHESSARTFLPAGQAPHPGQVFKNPDLAASLRKIAAGGAQVFYGGEIGRAIAAFSAKNGGLLDLADLTDHSTTWVDPIALDYRGYTVCELPPNGQGITALEILNILQGYDLAALGHNSADCLHLLIEAVKIAFSNRDHFVTDPRFQSVPIDRLLSVAYAERCRREIRADAAMAPPPPGFAFEASETVYLAAMDADGNAASFVSSIFTPFGSGMVVTDTGIALQNRASAFSLDPAHPNHLAPGKRPLHTIIPGLLLKGATCLMAFGVMGGDMQPQGHVQLLCNLIDFGLNPQEAVDAPRVRRLQGRTVYCEDGIAPAAVEKLARLGHVIDRSPTPVNKVGGAQLVYRNPQDGVLWGASDRRKDGCAIGF